ncbi:unnamed protein product [Urochloa humidicola]
MTNAATSTTSGAAQASPPATRRSCGRRRRGTRRARGTRTRSARSWRRGWTACARAPGCPRRRRRRRAADHRDMALEFAQRRKVAVGLEGDELCRSVQAAMDARVVGSCAYCGCNFSVVAVVDVPGLGGACGVCGRRVRVHDPAPPVLEPPASEEERWKGWLPW